MNESEQNSPAMDAGDLYHEEIFTDRRVGAIKRLTPVTGDGGRDDSRTIIYAGETQVLLGNSPLPIHFEIEADSLAEAAEKFAEAAEKSAQDTLKKLQDMRRDMQTSIVVPGQEAVGGMPGGTAPGGPVPSAGLAGGKLKMP